MQDLGTLGGSNSHALAINASGHVAGNSQTAGDAASHAFLWSGGGMQDLGTLGGVNSTAFAMNASDQVTGSSQTPGGFLRAFLWTGGSMLDLGTLPGGKGSGARAINASGQVVGNASTSSAGHAALWTGTEIVDLNTFTPVGSPFTLSQGVAINDAGQIAAMGFRLAPFELHIFLLTPSAFQFNGFFQPVDNPPVLNTVKAGTAVPVKFSLGGYHGLDIFEPGYPASQTIDCTGFSATDAVTDTVTAGASTLQYDSTNDQYVYVWKTDSAWTNSCRMLILNLKGCDRHQAAFQFKK
jgi:probable HAF family extracellular repeat protein